jgi:hypothetical protein
MRSMKTVAGILGLLLLASCGGLNSGLYGNNNRTYIETSTGDALPLYESNPNCEQVMQQYEYNLEYFWKGHFQLTGYSPQLDGFALNTNFFSRYVYGGGATLETEGSRTTEHSLIRPKILQLCSEQYTAKSYEGAALHASKYLNLAAKKFQGLNMKPLTPVSVWIAPKVEVRKLYDNSDGTVDVKKSYIVNNASYNRGQKRVTFYPQGSVDNRPIPFNGVPLWQVPMVISHEYGHHVFAEYFNSLSDLTGIKLDGDLCFDTSEGHFHSSTAVKTNRSRTVDNSVVLKTFNEGYADLFAYYVNGKKKNNLSKLTCLKRSRDVDSDFFYNFQQKKLGRDEVDIFFHQNVFAVRGCDEDVNYQDVHMIGAVIARFYRATTKLYGWDSTKSLRVLTQWVSAMAADYYDNRYLSPKQIMSFGLNKMAEVIGRNASRTSDKYNLCQNFDFYFPAFKLKIDCPVVQ